MRWNAASNKLFSLTSLCVVLLAFWIPTSSSAQIDEAFHPSHEAMGWSTKRNIVDIELSKPAGPLNDSIEPLRFRIERSYVFSKLSAPGHDILQLSFNRPTGLPQALVEAVSNKDRFHEDIPGIPSLTRKESSQQALTVEIDSNYSSGAVAVLIERLKTCSQIEDRFGLKVVSGAAFNCHSSWPAGKKWIISDPSAQAILECEGPDLQMTGCTLQFPFAGYAAKAKFSGGQLANWKDVMNDADVFLQAKLFKNVKNK